MRTISSTELNESLVDCSTLETVSFDPSDRTAWLRFRMEGSGAGDSQHLTICCRGVFQLVLAAYHVEDFTPLGIRETPTLARLSEILNAFQNQFIFEWELDADFVMTPDNRMARNQAFLLNDPAPSASVRGISVFKDASRGHFHLTFIGTALYQAAPDEWLGTTS